MFTSAATDPWLPTHPGWDDVAPGDLLVLVEDDLPANRAVSILETTDGRGVLTLTGALAGRLGLTSGRTETAATARDALALAGVGLHDPDALFLLPADTHAELADEHPGPGTRLLTAPDAAAFDRLVGRAPAEDVDEAFVELDHWRVCGTSVDGELVSVASAIPWAGSRLADVGVLTLPEHRGRGLARRTVRALCAEVLAQGREPQYRCQLDNLASVALASAAGLARLGTWEVVEA